MCTLSRIQCFGITQTHIQHHPDQVNMASGQGAAISSSRDNQPKVVSNHETSSKRVRGYVCPRCQLVLATQNERQTHIITCSSGPTSKGPTSFSKAWIETAEESRRRNEGAVTIDKVALPDSQPDINTQMQQTQQTHQAQKQKQHQQHQQHHYQPAILSQPGQERGQETDATAVVGPFQQTEAYINTRAVVLRRERKARMTERTEVIAPKPQPRGNKSRCLVHKWVSAIGQYVQCNMLNRCQVASQH